MRNNVKRKKREKTMGRFENQNVRRALKLIQSDKGLPIKRIAEIIGVKESTLYNISAGRQEPDQKIIETLCAKFPEFEKCIVDAGDNPPGNSLRALIDEQTKQIIELQREVINLHRRLNDALELKLSDAGNHRN